MRRVAFSADGKLALILVGDNVRILDLTALDALGLGPKDLPRFTSFSLAPDGKSFATIDADGGVLTWSLADGKSGKPFTGLGDTGRVAYSLDGKSLLGGDYGGAVVLWNARTGKAMKTFKTGTTITSVGFSPDGAFAYASGRDGGFRLWNLKTGKALPVLPNDHDADLARFSSDGKLVVNALSNGNATRGSLKTGALLATTARLTDGAVITTTPEGFLDGTGDVANAARLVRGVSVYPLGKALALLQRPDVVAVKLAGDEATVKAAAKTLDLNAALDGAEPSDGAVALSAKPTHVVIAKVTLREKPNAAAAAGDDLTPGMQVAVV